MLNKVKNKTLILAIAMTILFMNYCSGETTGAKLSKDTGSNVTNTASVNAETHPVTVSGTSSHGQQGDTVFFDFN